MKLGINTKLWSLAGISLEESLEGIAALGIRYVDILGREHGEPRLIKGKKKRIKQKLQELDLIPSNFCAIIYGNIASESQGEYRKCLGYMKECIDIADYLGYRQALTLCGAVEKGFPRDKAWSNAIRFLKECASYAQEHNICLAIESLQSREVEANLVSTVEDMVRMVEDVDSDYLRANVDLGHLNVTRTKPAELKKLEGLVVHIHISDNDGSMDANDLIGTGNTLIRDYLKALSECGLEETARKYDSEGCEGTDGV